MARSQTNDTPLDHVKYNLSPSKLPVKGCGLETHFFLCVNCDLDLGDVTLSLGMTPLGHHHGYGKSCEI